MQPSTFPVDHETLFKAWQSFVESGELEDSLESRMDSTILRSWRRCAQLLDPWETPHPILLEQPALNQILISQSKLLTIARPLMEDIYQLVPEADLAVILTDSATSILEILGTRVMRARLEERGWQPGSSLREEQTGSNALALALLEAEPVQVIGAEHYCKAYHDFTAAAAPIHDPNGRIAGALSIIGSREANHCQTLATVVAAARAMSNQFQTDAYWAKANRLLTELQSVLGAVSEGIISWNQQGKITQINVRAGEILEVDAQRATGKGLDEVIELPALLSQAIQNRDRLWNVEARLGVDGHFVDCVVSLQPTLEGLRGPIGYIITFQPLESVRPLLAHQTERQAQLTFDNVPGKSMPMRQVHRQARIAARGTAPVLLRGEDGVGKSVLAEAIHNAGTRAERPFITVNCLAIPRELLATEFLGYSAGASNGRFADGRPSKFELANRGTLFLREIESLTLEMQAALLQIIETGHVMRIGATRPIAVDVRIVAAASPELEQQVKEGGFLPKLYRRFGAFIIDVPSLRDRLKDLPLLVEYYLADVTQRMERAAFIDDEALAILRRYPWPGNIRELEHVLERAVVASENELIGPQDLPATVRTGQALVPGAFKPQPVLSLQEMEQEAIVRAGWAYKGQVTTMAEQLGISRTTLWRKMKRLGISSQDFKAH
jgi:transcriptional activator for dhaKLM operon